MKRYLAALAALLLLPLLAACGDDDGSDAEPDPNAAAEAQLVQMLVLTSAGGEVSPAATYVDEPDAMRSYRKTFEDRDDVAAAIQQAVKDAGERAGELAVATVAIGCDSPEHVTITEGDDGWEVTAGKIANPKQECFAPTTSIALVELPTA